MCHSQLCLQPGLPLQLQEQARSEKGGAPATEFRLPKADPLDQSLFSAQAGQRSAVLALAALHLLESQRLLTHGLRCVHGEERESAGLPNAAPTVARWDRSCRRARTDKRSLEDRTAARA